MASAYVDGLRMVGRRELSEAQVRERLARHGHGPDAIEGAIVRLKEERAIDDDRAARTIARRAASVTDRGRLRVRRQIESAGIAAGTARQVVDEEFAEIDEDALLGRALATRLPGEAAIADDREFGRLYRFLIGRGFEADAVVRALSARRRQGRGGSRRDEIE
jgi:regulatory protein